VNGVFSRSQLVGQSVSELAREHSMQSYRYSNFRFHVSTSTLPEFNGLCIRKKTFKSAFYFHFLARSARNRLQVHGHNLALREE
jgi:hypothetical protein